MVFDPFLSTDYGSFYPNQIGLSEFLPSEIFAGTWQRLPRQGDAQRAHLWPLYLDLNLLLCSSSPEFALITFFYLNIYLAQCPPKHATPLHCVVYYA